MGNINDHMKGKVLLPRLGMRTAVTVLALLCEWERGQSTGGAYVGNQAKLQKLMMGEIMKIEQPSPQCATSTFYTQINEVSRNIHHFLPFLIEPFLALLSLT